MKLDLASTFVVLQPDHSTALIEVTPTLFDELDRRFDGFRGRVLISSFSFDSDWPAWEMHVVVPKGTWHTARTSVPTKMLFVTPGQGTENKPV